MADTQKVEEQREQTRALEDLARTRLAYLKPLGPAEIKLLHAAAKGLIAFCGPSMDDHDPENDPSRAHWTSTDRDIRAEVLRWLLLDPEAVSRVDPMGISIHAARITGTLDLSFVNVRSPLRLWRCRVMQDVSLHQMQIPELSMTGSLVRSINATAINVKGDVSLNDKFMAYGEVILAGAQIGGNLVCQGGTFKNPGGIALLADTIDVKGSVFLRDKFMAEGEVRLPAAKIGGVLDCGDGTFQNRGGNALMADVIDVKSAVILGNNFMAEGEVRLVGAHLGHSLDCGGGRFKNQHRIALVAPRINVNGDVFLDNKFMAEGEVRLRGAQIDGNVECVGGAFTKLTLDRASVAGVLDWTSISNPGTATLSLTGCTVGGLIDDGKTSWPAAGNLFLDGFSYRRIEGGPKDAQSRLRWLALQKDFATQPYRQLAKVMSDAGDEKGARQVLFEMERLRRSKEHGVGAAAAGDGLLRLTVGYGYYPTRALWPLLGLSGLGWIIYRRAYLQGAMAPKDKEAYQSFKEQGRPPPYFRNFSPLVYSIENCAPLVNLGQADHWAPDPSAQPIALPKVTLAGRFAWLHAAWLSATQFFDRLVESPTFLQVFVWIQIILGWVLATLFVAGLTGIVRRD